MREPPFSSFRSVLFLSIQKKRGRGEEGKKHIFHVFEKKRVRTYLVRVLLVVSLEYYCMVLCSTVLFLAMKSGVPGTRVLRLLLLLLYDDDVCDNR